MLYPNDEFLIKVYLDERQRVAAYSASRRPVWQVLMAWLGRPVEKPSAHSRGSRLRPVAQEMIEKPSHV
ncbi:MAG TPA: hypothetical protein VMT46_09385 [Anaerolineaceae bacterium]|nr:hypothetical protein [Anaerolineaceae bacterium]